MAEAASLGEAMRHARRRLEAAKIDGAALDARLIVEHATGTSRLDLIADPGRPVSEIERDRIAAMLERRIAREPVHRIMGEREFYGLTMTLSPHTLEPRPDTEILVDAVLPFVRKGSAGGGCRILDLGTGTGAILIALLSQAGRASGVAADISAEALETASRNADLNDVADRFEAVRSDWFSAIEGRFDLIVSNPPYIPSSDVAALEDEVRLFDPQRALDGGNDGLHCYRTIAAGVLDHLVNDGHVAVEIGHDQKDAVIAIFEACGLTCREARKDLGGNDRVLVFEPKSRL